MLALEGQDGCLGKHTEVSVDVELFSCGFVEVPLHPFHAVAPCAVADSGFRLCVGTFDSRLGSRRGGFVQRGGDLLCKVAHARIEPVARTGFVGKPAVNGQHHFIRLGIVGERLGFVPEPEQLLLAVALADVDAELHRQSA